MVTGVAFQETDAASNCFGANKENKVAARRGHYQQCGPQTIILIKGFFFVLTALAYGLEDSNGLERRMRRIASLF